MINRLNGVATGEAENVHLNPRFEFPIRAEFSRVGDGALDSSSMRELTAKVRSQELTAPAKREEENWHRASSLPSEATEIPYDLLRRSDSWIPSAVDEALLEIVETFRHE